MMFNSCSVVFRASEVLNTANSEPQCIISCAAGDFDGDWECFQLRVQLHWDSGRLELKMFSDLFSCIYEDTTQCTVRLKNCLVVT